MWGKKAHQNLSSAMLTLTCAKGQGLVSVCVCVCVCSVMSNVATLWTVARQPSLFLGLPRQGYWSGLPFPSPGAQGSKPRLLHLLHWQVDSLPLTSTGKLKDYSRPFICSV